MHSNVVRDLKQSRGTGPRTTKRHGDPVDAVGNRAIPEGCARAALQRMSSNGNRQNQHRGSVETAQCTSNAVARGPVPRIPPMKQRRRITMHSNVDYREVEINRAGQAGNCETPVETP